MPPSMISESEHQDHDSDDVDDEDEWAEAEQEAWAEEMEYVQKEVDDERAYMMRLMLPEFSEDMDDNDPEYYDDRKWPEEP